MFRFLGKATTLGWYRDRDYIHVSDWQAHCLSLKYLMDEIKANVSTWGQAEGIRYWR